MDNVKFRLIAFAYFDNIPRGEMTVANAFSIRDAPFNADEIVEFSKDEGERTMAEEEPAEKEIPKLSTEI